MRSDFIPIAQVNEFLMGAQNATRNGTLAPTMFANILLSTQDVIWNAMNLSFPLRPFAGAHNGFVTGPMPNHNIPFEQQLNPNFEFFSSPNAQDGIVAAHKPPFFGWALGDFLRIGFLNGFANLSKPRVLFQSVAALYNSTINFQNWTIPAPNQMMSIRYDHGIDISKFGALLNNTFGDLANGPSPKIGILIHSISLAAFNQLKAFAPTNIFRFVFGTEQFIDYRTARDITPEVCSVYSEARAANLTVGVFENWWEGKWNPEQIFQAAACGVTLGKFDFQSPLEQVKWLFNTGAIDYLYNANCASFNSTDICNALQAARSSSLLLASNYSTPHNMDMWNLNPFQEKFYSYPIQTIGNVELNASRLNYSQSYSLGQVIGTVSTFFIVNAFLAPLLNYMLDSINKKIEPKKSIACYWLLSKLVNSIKLALNIIILGWSAWSLLNLWAGLSGTPTMLGMTVFAVPTMVAVFKYFTYTGGFEIECLRYLMNLPSFFSAVCRSSDPVPLRERVALWKDRVDSLKKENLPNPWLNSFANNILLVLAGVVLTIGAPADPQNSPNNALLNSGVLLGASVGCAFLAITLQVLIQQRCGSKPQKAVGPKLRLLSGEEGDASNYLAVDQDLGQVEKPKKLQMGSRCCWFSKSEPKKTRWREMTHSASHFQHEEGREEGQFVAIGRRHSYTEV